MEQVKIMIDSLESTLTTVEEQLLDPLRQRTDDTIAQKVPLLDLSRQQRVETVLDILRICSRAMNNFVTSMDGKLNGSASKVESVFVENLKLAVNQLHRDWSTGEDSEKSIATSNEKITMATVDGQIEKLSNQTERLLQGLQDMRNQLMTVIDINVTKAENPTQLFHGKTGVFDDFVLKNDYCLYKITDYRTILEHRPSQLDLLTTNLIDSMMILLNKP